MSAALTSILQLKVFHSYYESKICECLQFAASEETFQILKKYGFILKPIYGGFQLYTTTNSLSELFTYITETTQTNSFTFTATATNSNYYNFTEEVSLNKTGTLNYTSNYIDKTTDESLILSSKFEEKNSGNALQIEFFFEDIITQQQKTTTVNYEIHLNARKTQWRYYIIPNEQHAYENLSISSIDHTLTFSTPEAVTLQNGKKALVSSTGNTKIALSDSVMHKLNLINTKRTIAGERSETIIKGLPIPNTANLEILTDHSIASAIYINI